MMQFATNLWIQFAWLVELLTFFLLIVATSYGAQRICARLKSKYTLHSLDLSILTPLKVLLWVLFIAFTINLTSRHFAFTLFDPTPLRNIGIVICVTWFFFRWKTLFEKAITSRRNAGKKTIDPATFEVISKVYTIAVILIAALILLQNFGLNIAPFIAFGGIGAAALGFASKDVIANLYGGLTIYLARPFMVNDFIELPQKNLQGTIENIGWYFSTLRDLSMKPLYLPNAIFTTEIVVNASRMNNRYINETLSLRYMDSSKLEPTIHQIGQLLEMHPEIDLQQPIRVFIAACTPYSVNLEIRAYTRTVDLGQFVTIKSQILPAICDLIQKNGLTIGSPYPIAMG